MLQLNPIFLQQCIYVDLIYLFHTPHDLVVTLYRSTENLTKIEQKKSEEEKKY